MSKKTRFQITIQLDEDRQKILKGTGKASSATAPLHQVASAIFCGILDTHGPDILSASRIDFSIERRPA